jgi:hypothetical protein
MTAGRAKQGGRVVKERRWLTQGLFGLSCLIAGLLLLVVLVAPWFPARQPATTVWEQALDLFARDVVVRRISLAGALGLVVSAFVFFQPSRSRQRRTTPRRCSGQSPPTSPMAGA